MYFGDYKYYKSFHVIKDGKSVKMQCTCQNYPSPNLHHFFKYLRTSLGQKDGSDCMDTYYDHSSYTLSLLVPQGRRNRGAQGTGSP